MATKEMLYLLTWPYPGDTLQVRGRAVVPARSPRSHIQYEEMHHDQRIAF